MIILITLVGIAVFVAIFGYIFQRHRYSFWKTRGVFQEVPNLWFGKKTQYTKDFQRNLYLKYKNCGDPFIGYYFYHRPVALIIDLDLVKNIFIKDFQYFSDRGFGHNGVKDDPLGQNILFLDGAPWRALRHKLSPTVTTNKMKALMPDLLKVGQDMSYVISKKIETDPLIDFRKLITCFTTDVVGKCVLGIDYNTLSNPDAEICHILETYMDGFTREPFLEKSPKFPYFSIKWKLNLTPKSVSIYFMNVLQQIVKKRKEEKIFRKDFLTFIMELDSNMSINEIAASAFSYFIGGFHNNATALTITLYQLALNPLIQSKLRKEILSVLEKHNNEITYESLQEMPYLEMVINESLRTLPITPTISRMCVQDYKFGETNFVIPAGTKVHVPLNGIHNNPDIYPNPDEFDPQRFTKENIAKRHACSFMPFGDGPRNCIGLRFSMLETKIGVAEVIREFKLSKCEKTCVPLKMDPNSVVSVPLDEILLKVERI
ncbi:hypothetical protein ACFFRR_002712 [Megaselia abdita]